MTLQNYEKAIEILKERFGRNQVLINAHMESLSKVRAPLREQHSCLRNAGSPDRFIWQSVNPNTAKEITGTITLYNIQNKSSGRLFPE